MKKLNKKCIQKKKLNKVTFCSQFARRHVKHVCDKDILSNPRIPRPIHINEKE